MKYNNIVAWGLIISIGLAFLNAIFLDGADSVYQLAGLGFITFGIWAAVLLFKINKKK